MKTVTYIILSLFLTVVLTSCKKDTELWATKASGTIQKQGFTTYQYGTHILMDTSGHTIYALISKNSKLNLDNYIDKNVEIKGYKIKGYPIDGGPEYLEVSKVE